MGDTVQGLATLRSKHDLLYNMFWLVHSAAAPDVNLFAKRGAYQRYSFV